MVKFVWVKVVLLATNSTAEGSGGKVDHRLSGEESMLGDAQQILVSR
jgi:hypothetical protein